MKRNYWILSLSLLFCASAFPQNGGIIQCDPGMERIPAWIAPGRAYAAEQLNCGQVVSIVSLERGYMKIQIGERFVYVDAKYVRLLETQGLQTILPAEPGKQPQNPALPPQVPRPASSEVDSRRETSSPVINREYPLRHEGGLSFELSNIYYDEAELMRNKGFMWGASGDYTFRPNDFMFRLDGRLSAGRVDYWSDRTGTAEGLQDYNFESLCLP